MTKIFFLLLVIATFALSINAEADAGFYGPPAFPNWGIFQSSWPGYQIPNFAPIKPLTADDIKNMAPKDGSHVVGASVSRFSSSGTVNGVPVKSTDKERVVTNIDGKSTDNTYGN